MHNLLAVYFVLLLAPAATVDIPVDDLSGWTRQSYNKIRPNEVAIDNGALHIGVRGSASPLVFGFETPLQLIGITVVASWSGELQIPEGLTQGDENADDFVLKFGVVEAGDQTLNWLQRQIAADWIQQLFCLAPPDSGVRRINFLTTTQQAKLVGSTRTHPLSELLTESRILDLQSPGSFEMKYEFPIPVEALGLWISADGDDTGSDFDLHIERITLATN